MQEDAISLVKRMRLDIGGNKPIKMLLGLHMGLVGVLVHAK